MLVGTQQNEVPDSAFEVLPHTPLHAVVKSDLVVRQTQSPGPGRPSIGQIRTAGAGYTMPPSADTGGAQAAG